MIHHPHQETRHFVRTYGEASPVVNCTCGGFARRYPGGTSFDQIAADVAEHRRIPGQTPVGRP